MKLTMVSVVCESRRVTMSELEQVDQVRMTGCLRGRIDVSTLRMRYCKCEYDEESIAGFAEQLLKD